MVTVSPRSETNAAVEALMQEIRLALPPYRVGHRPASALGPVSDGVAALPLEQFQALLLKTVVASNGNR
jgi:hypothetical protein